MILVFLSFILDLGFARAIPESVGVLFAGIGLVVAALVLRRILKRSAKNVNLEMQHITKQG